MSWALLVGLVCTYSSYAAVSRPEMLLPGTSVTLEWNVTWGGPSLESGNDVVRDTSGNLYVGGQTAYGDSDAFLAKFQSNGDLLGNTTFGGPGEDLIFDLDIAPNGQIIGGGRTRGWGLPDLDGLALRWNADLTQSSNCSIGALGSAIYKTVATDTGMLVGGRLPYNTNQTFVALISNNCAQSWNFTFQFSTPVSVGGLARDKSGSVYMISNNYSNPIGVYSDIFIAKLDSTGHSLWNKTWDSGLGDSSVVATVTPSNHLLLGGYYNNSQNYDIILLEFDVDGNYLRNITWGGSGNDIPYSVAVARSGSIYAIGSTTSFGAGNEDGLVVKFDSSGSLKWNTTFGGLLLDEFYGLTLDDDGGIYVVGITRNWGVDQYDSNVLLIKLQDAEESGWWIPLVVVIAIAVGIVGVFLYFKLVKGRNIFKEIASKFKKQKKPVST